MAGGMVKMRKDSCSIDVPGDAATVKKWEKAGYTRLDEAKPARTAARAAERPAKPKT